MYNHKDLVRRLLRRAGSTYAQEAGIRLRNQPMPLFQLLVLCLLSDQPTDTDVAARAARELFRSGLRTPHTILATDRGAVLRALARANYRRYDESSATALVETAETVQEDYRGDLRLLAERSGRDTRSATTLLKGFSGIGRHRREDLSPRGPGRLAVGALHVRRPRAGGRTRSRVAR